MSNELLNTLDTECAAGLDLSIPPGRPGNQWSTYRSRYTKKYKEKNGRPKGSPNKVTVDMQQAVREAFEELGGKDWLVEQAKENPELFMRLAVKLMPTTIEAEVRHSMSDVLERIVTGREAVQRLRSEGLIIEHQGDQDDEDSGR